MIFTKKTANLVYVGLFILYILGEYLINLSDEPTIKKQKPQEDKIAEFVNKTKDQNFLYLIKEAKKINEYDITKQYDKIYNDYFYFIAFRNNQKDMKNAVALGVDKRYHITNYFLEGYAPFETQKLWVPLQTLARKKIYQLDNLQYKGYTEIWQTSSEAFKYTRGDCEDHAIALADWLIEMGEDARVVLGHYKTEGHAWVVLFKDDKEYILEATQKKNLKNPYRLAKYQTHYKPKAMFNRDSFWINKGSINTTNYSSSKWSKQSTYIRSI